MIDNSIQVHNLSTINKNVLCKLLKKIIKIKKCQQQ